MNWDPIGKLISTILTMKLTHYTVFFSNSWRDHKISTTFLVISSGIRTGSVTGIFQEFFSFVGMYKRVRGTVKIVFVLSNLESKRKFVKTIRWEKKNKILWCDKGNRRYGNVSKFEKNFYSP